MGATNNNDNQNKQIEILTKKVNQLRNNIEKFVDAIAKIYSLDVIDTVNIPVFTKDGKINYKQIDTFGKILENIKNVGTQSVKGYIPSDTPKNKSVPVADKNGLLSLEWFIWKISDRNPSYNDVPPNDKALWFNKQTGELFIAKVKENPNTHKKTAIWVGSLGNTVNSGGANYGKVDIFGDGSCIAYYPLKYNTKDLASSNYLINNYNRIVSGMYTYWCDWTKPTKFYHPINLKPKLLSGFTISYQFNPQLRCSGGDSNGTMFCVYRNGTASNDWELISVWYSNSSYMSIGLTKHFQNLYMNKWYTIVYTFDGKRFCIYVFDVNAKLLGKQYANIGSSSVRDKLLHQFWNNYNRIDIGTLRGDLTEQDAVPGFYKNLRIFNRAITDDEAKILAKED